MGCQILRPYRNARWPQVNRKCYGLRDQKSTRGGNYANLAAIMGAHYGVVSCVRPAVAFRFGACSDAAADAPLDFSTGAWVDLLFRVFLAGLSNSRIDWASWNSPRQ